MSRWAARLSFVAIVWAGAFGAAALAVEWRREDSADLSQLTADLQAVEADVARLKAVRLPTPTPSPTPVPEEIRVSAEPGTVLEWAGYTVTLGAHRSPGQDQFGQPITAEYLDLTVVNVSGNPYATPYFSEASAVDVLTFACNAYVNEDYSRNQRGRLNNPLPQGQAIYLVAQWDCEGLSLKEFVITRTGIVLDFTKSR